MSNYQFEIVVEREDGDGDVLFPILVHELFGRPHKVLGVAEWASDEQIEDAIEKLEAKLGYELERADDLRMSTEEAAKYLPKQAGFDPLTGEFRAG